MFFIERDVGLFGLLSIAGINKCAIITLPIPSLKICLKGYNSIESSCAIDLLITGKSR